MTGFEVLGSADGQPGPATPPGVDSPARPVFGDAGHTDTTNECDAYLRAMERTGQKLGAEIIRRELEGLRVQLADAERATAVEIGRLTGVGMALRADLEAARREAEQLRTERDAGIAKALAELGDDIEVVIGQWPGTQPDWVTAARPTFNGALIAVLRLVRARAVRVDLGETDDH